MPRMHLVERSGLVVLIGLLTTPLMLSPATIIVDGSCELPDAIEAANTDIAVGGCNAGSGADTLRLTGDVALTAEPPPVTTEIRVEGRGFTVSQDSGSSGRLFKNDGPGDLTLVDIVLTGGNSDSDGGAIHNVGTLRVEGSLISNSFANDEGGGIFNKGVTTIVNSTISGNEAFLGNGGGIYADFSASTTLIDSTVSNNYSFWEGSGIFSYEGGVTLTGSTISDNQQSGLVVFYPFQPDAVVVTNSTISGNGVDGMYILGGYEVLVSNTTFANNSDDNVDGYTYNDANLFTNSVFAYAGNRDCFFSGFVDGGGNFDTDGTCSTAALLTGFDTLLADNGGPTQTHALLPGSSAIDGGGDCGLPTDQRGFGRNGDCDSGAYEFEGTPAVTSSVVGLTPQAARCINLTGGGSVTIPGETSWNCRAAGLPIDAGNLVRQSIRGLPSAPTFSGMVDGLHNARVRCQNFLTGQTVQFALGDESEFSCSEQGLNFSADNQIGWTVTGVAD